jgi:hypothetical protein
VLVAGDHKVVVHGEAANALTHRDDLASDPRETAAPDTANIQKRQNPRQNLEGQERCVTSGVEFDMSAAHAANGGTPVVTLRLM